MRMYRPQRSRRSAPLTPMRTARSTAWWRPSSRPRRCSTWRCSMAKAPKAEPTLEELAHAQALRDVAIELRAIDDTIDYLESIRALKRANIRAELEARGLRSSETIVRGMKAALSPFEIIVCTCH